MKSCLGSGNAAVPGRPPKLHQSGTMSSKLVTHAAAREATPQRPQSASHERPSPPRRKPCSPRSGRHTCWSAGSGGSPGDTMIETAVVPVLERFAEPQHLPQGAAIGYTSLLCALALMLTFCHPLVLGAQAPWHPYTRGNASADADPHANGG
eukprot:CAMPEP_0171109812 /NCGR_PEP_ID=MMETSP0766_2-20121228/70992_1 /TAXON_ID=439317 /ORGANISM="Gambierdiscus australes, Strain CAWD 149" /LENGTH=151 /DNA_ID=CAMNT_0011571595 /DNA_START=45 /DNA_END=497 /DNA_ORIENTATION=+